MRLQCMINFASMALPLARLHSHPLQYWLKENYKTPAYLFKGAEVKPWGCSDPALATHLQATTKFNTQMPNRGSVDNRSPRRVMGAIWTTCPSRAGGLQKGQEHLYQYPGTGNSVDGLSTAWGIITGEDFSFQIDNTTAVAYLLKQGGMHCKTLNGLVRKILLKCHENGIKVCPEYLRGVVNLQADILFRGKKAKEWSLWDPAFHRLFKQ